MDGPMNMKWKILLYLRVISYLISSIIEQAFHNAIFFTVKLTGYCQKWRQFIYSLPLTEYFKQSWLIQVYLIILMQYAMESNLISRDNRYTYSIPIFVNSASKSIQAFGNLITVFSLPYNFNNCYSIIKNKINANKCTIPS